MTGMIKKDLLMIKDNQKRFLVVLAIYLVYSILFDMDMSFLLFFIGWALCMSTFSYDDHNNWHAYATSLPQGKINIVKSKYITITGLNILYTLIGLLMNFITGSVRGTLNIEESLFSLMGVLFSMELLMTLSLPFLFKYGAEKGRIVMYIFLMGIAGATLLTTEVIKPEPPANLLAFLDSYFPIIFIVLSVLMIAISYHVSKKIYLKREF